MKKIFYISLGLFLLFSISITNAAQVWQYGSFHDRAVTAERLGIVSDASQYHGTYEQNVKLLEYYQGYAAEFGANASLPIAGTTYNLAGSGVSSSATSITLQSFTITQTGQKIIDSDLADTFFLTLEPGNKTKQEIASCTTVTQNSGGTATLSGCLRGLAPISPYTASTTLRFSHAGGSQVIFSDPPQLFNLYGAKGNDETITGNWKLGTDCTVGSANDEICAKAYIDSVGSSGASNANETTKGISELATSAELAAGTSIGGTGARLIIPNDRATSTPDGTSYYSFKVPVSESDGKLNQNWLDLAEGYTWTGTHNFNGNLVSNATTTINNVLIGAGFGGNGLDGALSVTAGATTTINAATAPFVVKNYTSITIPNTAGLTVSNASTTGTILYLRSQGDCTIAGNIWMKGKGASGQSPNYMVLDATDHFGSAGNNSTNDTAGAQVTGGAVFSGNQFFYSTPDANRLMRSDKYITVGAPGRDGGRNTAGDSVAGVAGAGGGGIILECGGTLTFTGSIDVSGANGTNGTAPSGNTGGAGGGGGGAGGQALVVYNWIQTNTGLINTRGGKGGNGSNGSVADSSSTGGGASGGPGAGCYSAAGGVGGVGGTGNATNNGAVGGASTSCAGGGGGGGGSDNNGQGGVGATPSANDANNFKLVQNILY